MRTTVSEGREGWACELEEAIARICRPGRRTVRVVSMGCTRCSTDDTSKNRTMKVILLSSAHYQPLAMKIDDEL